MRPVLSFPHVEKEDSGRPYFLVASCNFEKDEMSNHMKGQMCGPGKDAVNQPFCHFPSFPPLSLAHGVCGVLV